MSPTPKSGKPQDDPPSVIRKRLKQIKKEIDQSYIQWGKDFYLVYHRRLFAKWGFDTFTDYVEGEVGIARQRADRCRRIWTKFVKECAVPPRDMWGLGFTNALLLQPVITPQTAKTWIDKARGFVRDEHGKIVEKKGELTYRQLELEIAESKNPDPEAVEGLPAVAPLPPINPNAPAPTLITPGPDGRVPFSVKMYPSQWQVMDAAIAEAKRTKAEEMAENEAMAHIATEFLAQRMVKEEQPLVRVRFLLANLNQVYGGRFFWIPTEEAATFLSDAMAARPDLFEEPIDDEDDDE